MHFQVPISNFSNFISISEHPSNEGKLPIRRERTYEDVDNFLHKLEIEEGDEGKFIKWFSGQRVFTIHTTLSH